MGLSVMCLHIDAITVLPTTLYSQPRARVGSSVRTFQFIFVILFYLIIFIFLYLHLIFCKVNIEMLSRRRAGELDVSP